jgi:hypothetical protein
VHVFATSDENCSRRTQAAAVAYMFPPNTMRIAIQLRLLTTARRYAKLTEVFLNVDVPTELAVKSQTVYAALFANEKSVIVCDGGFNYSLPTSPPPSVRKFYLLAINLLLFVSNIQIRQLEPQVR